MDTNRITDLATLYECLEKGQILWASLNKKEILRSEMARINRKRYYGKFILVKKIVVSIRPIRYLLALHHYQTIVSFRPEKLREQICHAAKADILKNFEQYRQAYELLDNSSQKIYLNMLIYRLTGNYNYSIDSQSSNEQYFSERISWNRIRTVVDCGAYIGDTLRGFIKHKIAVKNYYLYELNNDNYSKMQEVCQLAKSNGIITHPRKKGVYNRPAILYFEAAADSSMLVDYPTDNSISVIALDEDIHEKVDFIKMDIEGSELEALNGAVKIIRRDKPVLAICIYHKQDDFWKIPLRIKEICSEYKKFWIEQYSPWDIETVLFAEV